jgi:hypothetical protein
VTTALAMGTQPVMSLDISDEGISTLPEIFPSGGCGIIPQPDKINNANNKGIRNRNIFLFNFITYSLS